jgi:hypothetical protein
VVPGFFGEIVSVMVFQMQYIIERLVLEAETQAQSATRTHPPKSQQTPLLSVTAPFLTKDSKQPRKIQQKKGAVRLD